MVDRGVTSAGVGGDGEQGYKQGTSIIGVHS